MVFTRITGSDRHIFLYEGVIPSSGKQVFEFDGIKLCHRSIKADKCDILVHIETKAFIRAYPFKTDRSVILDDVSNNIDLLKHFISHTEDYNLVTKAKHQDSKKNVVEVKYDTYKEPSYSRSGNYAHLNKDNSCVTKKKYNLMENLEW